MTAILHRLRRHPLVHLSQDRVRERAYFLSLAQPERTAIEHWLDAEDEETRLYVKTLFLSVYPRRRPEFKGLLFEEHYEPVFSWSADPWRSPQTPKLVLGTKEPRQCSICGRTRPSVSFKAEAHVLPEQLGTGALLTWDECNECNHRTGRDYEDDLGKMLLVERAVAGTPNKTGTAKVKYSKAGAFVAGKPRSERGFIIGVKEDDDTVQSSLSVPGQLTLSVKAPKFRPRRVVKALAKITWQALPVGLRAEAEPIRCYINEQLDWEDAQFHRAAVPGLSRTALGVWRRLDGVTTELPLYVTLVSTADTVIFWACPDFATGKYRLPILPLFPTRAWFHANLVDDHYAG